MSGGEILTPGSVQHLVQDQLLAKPVQTARTSRGLAAVHAADYGIHAETGSKVHIERRIIGGSSRLGVRRDRVESIIRLDIPEDPRTFIATSEGNSRTLTVVTAEGVREVGPDDSGYLAGVMRRLIEAV